MAATLTRSWLGRAWRAEQRSTMATAASLVGSEWRRELTKAMQAAPPGAAGRSPFRLSMQVKGSDEAALGTLHLAAAAPLSSSRPGNGGMRLWSYVSGTAAETEASKLALGMEIKHASFNTGFSGAKLVCAAEQPIEAWSGDDKQRLMDAAACMLTELDGAMFTGCDMNTTTEDMDYLAERCPFVLAAVGNPSCCPNAATAHGVLGALDATFSGEVSGKRFVVHGCGNVGRTVALGLVERGAEVLTVDLDAARAALPGCKMLDAGGEWWATPCDALVPCSASGLLTAERAGQLQCEAIVGATNLPFASEEAQAVAERELGITFVPEGITSAGAVIVDSIEYWANDAFSAAAPPLLYSFTAHVVGEKVSRLIELAQRLNVPPSLAVPLVAESDSSSPVGARFEEWRTSHAAAAASEPALSDSASRELLARAFLTAQASRCQPELLVARNGVAGASASASASHAASLSGARRHSSASSGRVSGRADVVVVGGGIMGLNIAYQLRRRSPDLSVLVLERAPALGAGSSGYSTGFQRAYYSFDETMAFALDGMDAYKNWSDYLRDGEANASFTETGALWMLGYDGSQNEGMVQRLAKFGVAAEQIDEAELGRRYPMMSPEPFPTFDEDGNETPHAGGAFSAVYEHGCGHIDSSTCLEDLLRACRRDGAEVRLNQRVHRFVTAPSTGRCTGVEMADGSLIEAGVAVVNASGPWFNKLNSTVGLSLSTTALPTRIQVGHKWIPDEYCSLPFVADGWGPSGIYFMPRAANNQLVFGSVAHRFESEIVDPDAYNASLDPDVKQDYLNCLFHRLPNLPREGEIVGFSSMYTVNQDDVHPMIGETRVAGLWACNGFSGHGFKLAPAVGSLVAQQITGAKTDAWETGVPHDFMGPYREPLSLKVKTHFA
mmetsp:Transcript_40925/g.123954  ORF Transcript_40925/g.123954 Transcript_40925/m.123954 type:complete len:897 (+) Transcript_40925:31-2721(+)